MKKIILVLLLIGLLLTGINCATIVYPSRTYQMPEQRSEVDYPMLVLDLLLTGPLGILVDYTTGAIYTAKPAGNPVPSQPATQNDSGKK
jgi:hypothetical protein